MLGRLTKHDIVGLADRVGWFSLSDAEAEDLASLSDAILELLDEVDQLRVSSPRTPLDGEVTGSPEGTAVGRSPGRPPGAGEDPLNAVVRWCRVQAASDTGLLGGSRLALKDSVSAAGIPMTFGSSVVREHVPPIDSVVVERILQAGGDIVAMANMDDFAFSGGGDTSAHGNIGNPFAPERSAGGSSGGSAAALYYRNAVDMSIGTDQGGSIRLPAAWCGVLGLKPTHSLVPYTGIAGIDATFDHAGPLARSVSSLARLLAAIAGPHRSDPRQQHFEFKQESLLELADNGKDTFDGVRIGLLTEGFSEEEGFRKKTSAAVRRCAERIANAGAVVEEVSIPAHLKAGGIAFAGFIEGMAALLRGGGNGYHWSGRYSPELAMAVARGLRMHGDELAPQLKLVSLLGEYLSRNYGGAVYAAAQNYRPWLRHNYDAQLQSYDALLLPTAPYPAYKHDAEMPVVDRVLRGWEPLGNCAPSDMTGHPAISLPVATVDGLPVGMMLIGRQWDDARLIELAGRYERRIGWDPLITSQQSVAIGPAAPPV